ncbi:ankyrin repeat domain-containing protein, partial [Candidatus Bathyarchaeota archaeon]|nr:ankyrin repeat domain-containing protein [Candidatus Bathyarchaeota archaeon]
REDFAAKGPSFSASTRTLWRVICSICKEFIPADVEILFVLDGLDQCEESSRSTLIRELLSTFSRDEEADAPSFKVLRELLSTFPGDEETEAPRFKVLITSRPTADLELAFRQPCGVTRDRGEDRTKLLKKDIERVIHHRVGQLGSKKLLKRGNGSTLRSKTTIWADGSFLYVDAVFKSLAKRGCYSEAGINEAVKDAEHEVAGMYERALTATDHNSLTLFQYMLVADSPLSLGAINAAMALRADVRSVRELERELEPDIEYTVKRIGGSLVCVTNGQVSFIHTSASRFLREREMPGGSPWEASKCHLTMADRCLRFLTAIHEPKEEESFDTPLATAPFKEFYDYAVAKWSYHTAAVGAHEHFDPAQNESPEILKLWDSLRLLCDPERGYLSSTWSRSCLNKVWKEKKSKSKSESSSPSSESESSKSSESPSSVKGTLTRQGSSWYLTTADGPPRRQYLLHRAARRNNEAFLHALLVAAPNELSITDKDDFDDDVLTVAVESMNHDLVSWIMRNFAGAPLQREAALATALGKGVENGVLSLLCPENRFRWEPFRLRPGASYETWRKSREPPHGPGVPTTTKDMDPETAALLANNLSFACIWGRSNIVAGLLKEGANANQKSGGMLPLLAAALSGDAGLVDLLLDRGANPDEPFSPEEAFLNPERKATVDDLKTESGYMTAGAIEAFWTLVWRYLGAGALGITPLTAAAQSGRTDLADSMMKHGSIETTITLALERAFPECTGSTASAEARDATLHNLHSLRNPQSLARGICHRVISDGTATALSELIGYGCMKLPPDEEGKTLLHHAAESGNVMATKVLINKASKEMLWSRDVVGLTCLRTALLAGHADVAMKLQATDPELQRLTTELKRPTTERRTLLQDAVYGGVKRGAKVVEDVLALMASNSLAVPEGVDATDDQGRTALHHVVLAAKQWGSESKDDRCFAVDVLKALVVGGAEYNLVDKEELTPLVCAKRAVEIGRVGSPPFDERVQAALVELETTLGRVPLWGDNRLDMAAIRGNYEQILEDQNKRVEVEDGDNWMFESEEEYDDDDGDEDEEADE